MSPLLGHAPKLVFTFLNTTWVSISHYKESKVCAFLVSCITILCPSFSSPHPNIFVCLTNHFLPCALHLFVNKSTQGVHILDGCHGIPLHLPSLQVVVVPRNFHQLTWALFPSLDLITTQWLLIPQPMLSRKTLLNKFFYVCPSVGFPWPMMTSIIQFYCLCVMYNVSSQVSN